MLERANARATFFMIGRQIGSQDRSLLLRELRDGDVLGDHTYDHPDLTRDRRRARRAAADARAHQGGERLHAVRLSPALRGHRRRRPGDRPLGRALDGALERRPRRLHPARHRRDRSPRARAGAPGLDRDQPRRRRPARADARGLPRHHRESSAPAATGSRRSPKCSATARCTSPASRCATASGARALRCRAARSSSAPPERRSVSVRASDRRRLDPAPDAPLPRAGDVRLAAPLDRRRDPGGGASDRRDAGGDGRRRGGARGAVRVARARRGADRQR